MGNIGWTDRVRNEEVLHTVKQERNVVHTIKRRKSNWTGHVLRRNCFVKLVLGKIERTVEVTGIRQRRDKQLRDEFKERSGYCKLK
jgi:hypothetical protein